MRVQRAQAQVLPLHPQGGQELEEELELPKDSDGSAKVALIGIDRSIAGWRMMQLSLPDGADSIVPLILQLEMLRTRLETAFPEARDFIRPGFDEIVGQDFRI